jgi:hypothetical protein
MNEGKDELIAQLERSRARLNAALQLVAPQQEIYPSWMLKQVMDHITGWDELVASSLRQHSRGEATSKVVLHGINQYNVESVNARQSLSLDQSRQAYEAARNSVLQAIRSMPADKLEEQFRAPWGGVCTLARVVEIFASHESEHARQIESLLNKSPGSV